MLLELLTQYYSKQSCVGRSAKRVLAVLKFDGMPGRPRLGIATCYRLRQMVPEALQKGSGCPRDQNRHLSTGSLYNLHLSWCPRQRRNWLRNE